MIINPLLTKGRFLFVESGCPHCEIWKSFVERINVELKFDKRIKIIDCTNLYEFKIIENSIINLFRRYLDDSFPIMFIDSIRKDGTNTRVEAEAWLRSMVHEDFLEPRYNEFMFNKECEYGRKGILRKKVVCN